MTDEACEGGHDGLLELSEGSLGDTVSLGEELVDDFETGISGHGASDAGEEDESNSGFHCRCLVVLFEEEIEM